MCWLPRIPFMPFSRGQFSKKSICPFGKRLVFYIFCKYLVHIWQYLSNICQYLSMYGTVYVPTYYSRSHFSGTERLLHTHVSMPTCIHPECYPASYGTVCAICNMYSMYNMYNIYAVYNMYCSVCTSCTACTVCIVQHKQYEQYVQYACTYVCT